MESHKEYELQDLPYNREIIFSNHKNIYKKGIEKRQKKLLKKCAFIKPFLMEDEEIYLITTGCSPISVLEQFFMGWVVFYAKRSLFVFTNKRVFHIPTNTDYSYRNSIAQIAYADCKSIALKGRKLVIKYAAGETDNFLYIASKEKNKIKSILENISFVECHTEKRKMVHLCPRCTEPLEEDKYTCPNCRLEFKNKDDAMKISLIYPGGGYFYTRHPFLGLGDAITETVLILLLVTAVIETVNRSVYDGVFIFGIALILEKILTVYDSNRFIKEYIPREKEIGLFA